MGISEMLHMLVSFFYPAVLVARLFGLADRAPTAFICVSRLSVYQL